MDAWTQIFILKLGAMLEKGPCSPVQARCCIIHYNIQDAVLLTTLQTTHTAQANLLPKACWGPFLQLPLHLTQCILSTFSQVENDKCVLQWVIFSCFVDISIRLGLIINILLNPLYPTTRLFEVYFWQQELAVACQESTLGTQYWSCILKSYTKHVVRP